MNPGVDEGILMLAGDGRLSAVSCMPLGQPDSDRVRALTDLDVDLGLHLDFTECLDHQGFRLPLGRLILACYTRQVPVAMIEQEIVRQLDAFEACFGRMPDYVDGHQHVHQLPGIRERLLKILADRYSGRRCWLRSTLPPEGARLPFAGKARIIGMLGGWRLRALADQRAVPMNRSLLGVYDFSGDREAYAALIERWLTIAVDGDLLMCHPATSKHQRDAIAVQRLCEFDVLSGPRFTEALTGNGVSIRRFSPVC